MKITSMLAIYLLFWVFSGLLMLPLGVRTHDEAGISKVPGQADSAPANFNPRLIIGRTTIVSLVLFALFYLNYTQGWVTMDDIIPASFRPS